MTRKFILSLISIGFMATCYADDAHQATRVEHFQLNDTIVDWQDNGMIPLQDGKCFASLSHNNDGIFFQILVKDRKLQQQFLHRGMVVYVDPNGKKKKKYSVQFPTLPPPQRPRHGRPGEHAERGDTPTINPADTSGLFNEIGPRHRHGQPRPRFSKKERERHLKMLLSQLSQKPASFYINDDEGLMSQDSTKISASGNNLVFSSFIGYNKLGKIGKKNEISLGITVKESESENNDRQDGPPGGMFGPPPGMGRMMPPPGMGGRGRFREMLKENKKFSEWIVFSTKISNFTE